MGCLVSLIVGLFFGGILAAVLASAGLGELAFVGFIVGLVGSIYLGTASGISTRFGDTWIHHDLDD